MSQNKVPYELVYHDKEITGLTERFGSEYRHFVVFDEEGYFFRHPEEIEFDVVEKDDTVILFEISFWIYKAGVYTLQRKVEWYEKKHNVKVDRKIVISQIVDMRANVVIARLGF